jgi:hypothetical protein
MNKKTNLLSTSLGLREKTEINFKAAASDMFNKFTKKQGLFQGERKTYEAKSGYADEPTKRNYRHVQSTVQQQLDWLEETCQDFMDVVFSIEKTNASGNVQSELIVEGNSWGLFTSLELLRLKTILDNSKFKSIYSELPIRKKTEDWVKSDDSEYSRTENIYQTVKAVSVAKTTTKESYIMTDPHFESGSTRPPVTSERSTQIEIGDYSSQKFSGEISLADRAHMIKRYDTLSKSVLVALNNANNTPTLSSDLGGKVFNYIHGKG